MKITLKQAIKKRREAAGHYKNQPLRGGYADLLEDLVLILEWKNNADVAAGLVRVKKQMETLDWLVLKNLLRNEPEGLNTYRSLIDQTINTAPSAQ